MNPLESRPPAQDGSESNPADNIQGFDIRYSNCFQVGHNAFEFLLEFGQIIEPLSKLQIHTRILCTPPHLRNLVDLLHASLTEYETSFGPVPPEPGTDL